MGEGDLPVQNSYKALEVEGVGEEGRAEGGEKEGTSLKHKAQKITSPQRPTLKQERVGGEGEEAGGSDAHHFGGQGAPLHRLCHGAFPGKGCVRSPACLLPPCVACVMRARYLVEFVCRVSRSEYRSADSNGFSHQQVHHCRRDSQAAGRGSAPVEPNSVGASRGATLTCSSLHTLRTHVYLD